MISTKKMTELFVCTKVNMHVLWMLISYFKLECNVKSNVHFPLESIVFALFVGEKQRNCVSLCVCAPVQYVRHPYESTSIDIIWIFIYLHVKIAVHCRDIQNG